MTKTNWISGFETSAARCEISQKRRWTVPRHAKETIDETDDKCEHKNPVGQHSISRRCNLLVTNIT
jgi:hypothetical protein